MEETIGSRVEAAAASLRERLPLLRSGVALNHAGVAPQPNPIDGEARCKYTVPAYCVASVSSHY